MTIHVLGAIDPTTHYGLKSEFAVKNFRDPNALPWAMVASDAVLGGTLLAPIAGSGSSDVRRMIVRAGRMGVGSAGDESSEPAAAWGSWSPRGQAAFESEIDRLTGLIAGLGVELVLWPRIGDALSDIPSCLSFLRRHESGPFRLMIEPAALLDESMLLRAAEHLERIIDSFAEHSGVAATMMSNVEVHEGRAECVPLGRGLIPRALIDGMASRLGSIAKPLVVRDFDDAAAIAGPACPA